MPELPEVETVRIGLSKLIPGRTVSAVSFDWPKSFPNANSDVKQFLIGAQVVDVKRRAKVLLIELSSNYSLVIHLKMTGQLVFIGPKHEVRSTKRDVVPDLFGDTERKKQKSADPVWIPGHAPVLTGLPGDDIERFGAGHPNDSLIGELPDKSTRVIITFTDDSTLFFNDQRKFGWVRLMPTAEVVNLDFFQKVGPEPLAADFTWQAFRERLLRRKNSNVKAALLDQTVVAGIGNIYADESLWGAQIHPLTLVKDLQTKQFETLYEELVMVLELAIEKGGSTDRNYVNAEGRKGSYMSFARVFRREGQACPRCGHEIIKTRVAGRGTHLCPNCQKEPK